MQSGHVRRKGRDTRDEERLASYFFSMDVFWCKTYFAEMLKKRPDVLMEASDITGELKLSMQIIATMDRGITTDGALLSEKRKPFSGTYHFIYEIECSDTCIHERTGHRGGQALFDRAEC